VLPSPGCLCGPWAWSTEWRPPGGCVSHDHQHHGIVCPAVLVHPPCLQRIINMAVREQLVSASTNTCLLRTLYVHVYHRTKSRSWSQRRVISGRKTSPLPPLRFPS
jgi:hypothetical protein